MQKKLIALAVAGLASTAAFAQSNVTIYGVADVTFEQARATGGATTAAVAATAAVADPVTGVVTPGTAAVAATGNRDSFTRVNSNSSYIGFKGAEDLGNGLKAVFQVETAVNMDTGGFGGGRDTYVGLAGGFGTVVGGLVTGPTRGLAARMDLNSGATGPGANSSIVGKPVGGAGAGILDTRLANTVAYISPNFSGFNAVVGYSSGENRTNNGVASAAVANLKAWDIGLNYQNGPIDIGYAYANIDTGVNNPTTATTTVNGTAVAADKWVNHRLAGAFTFGGGHKVVALWERSNVDLAVAAGANEAKRTTWGLGGKFMVTPAGGLIAQYYVAKELNLGGKVANTGAKLMEVGYEHALSKRTIAKASYAQLKNDSAAGYDFNVGAVGGNLGAGADPRVISVGVRHSF